MYSAIMTQILLRHDDYQKLNNNHISAHRIYDKKGFMFKRKFKSVSKVIEELLI